MKTYHHGNLRQQLIDRGVELVSSKDSIFSSGEISLRGIARDLGVSATAVYHHFPSKEALLESIVIHLFQELLSTWEGKDGFELGQSYVGFFLDHPGVLHIMFGPTTGMSTRVQELQAQAFEVLTKALSDLPTEDQEPMALLFWVLAHGIVSLTLSGSLGVDPQSCPGVSPLFYQSPGELLKKFEPYLRKGMGE